MPDRVVSMYVMVFRRSEREITPDDWDWPTGGSYLDPVPENSYWTRMPLYNQYPLYVSTRIFTSDGLYPQEEQWTPPVIFTKHGDKGDTGANGGDGFDGSDGDPGAVGTPGTPGIDGAAGVSGDSIIWAGEATAHPINPINGTAYYNTSSYEDGGQRSYVWFDGAWYQMTVDGKSGQDGYNNAVITLYRASTSSTVEPAAFSGTFTYDFTTGVLYNGDFNNWTQAMPSVPVGSYLWARQASAVSNTTTDYEVAATEFTPAVVLSAVPTNGLNGLDGTSVVLKGSVALIADLPVQAPTGDLYVVLDNGNGYVSDGASPTSVWTSVGAIQGPQGDAGLYVQVVYHSASVTGGTPTLPTNAAGDDNGWYTDAIAASNWMSVKVDDGTGTTWGGAIQITGFDGLNSATVFLYIKNTSGTVAPTVMPTGPFTYTFATGGLTTAGNFNGWSKTPPTLTQGEFLWVMQATASSQTATDSIPFSEFSPPVVTTSAGKDGLTISYLGDLATPPIVAIKNQVYKDTDNGNVYICTVGGSPGTWVLMVADGSDGVQGANGANGLSVYITYNPASISGAAPTLPTNIAGTDNDWTTVASSNSNWMSQKIDANPAVSTNWGPAIRIKGDTGADLVANPNAPPAPVNLQVTSYYATIGLSWDVEASPLMAFAHILRHTSNDRGSAKIVGVTAGNTFIDTPPPLSTATTYFYWVRFISPSQVLGPDNLVNGTSGQTTANPAYLLSMLTGQLGYGQFDVTNGVFPIRTVTALPTLPSNNWPNGSRAYLTTDKTIYLCNGATFTAEADQAAIRASFGVGVLTAGSILAENIGTNEIIANSANIKDAVITSTKIGSVNADTINSGTINAINITGSTITGSTLQTSTSGERFTVSHTAKKAYFYDSTDVAKVIIGFGNAVVGYTPLIYCKSENTINGLSIHHGSVAQYMASAGILVNSDKYGVFSHINSASITYAAVYGESSATSGEAVRGQHNSVTNVSIAAAAGISGVGNYGVFGSSYGPGNACFRASAFGGCGTYTPFTGSHDGFIKLSSLFEEGDIVIDIKIIGKFEVSDTLSQVEPSTLIKDKRVIGIVTTSYGARIGDISQYPALRAGTLFDIDLDDFVCININSLGEGQINVCKDGGNIMTGDYICSSSRSGKGMKQDDDLLHNYTVAKARESAIWLEGEDNIKTIACTYHCG